MRRNFILKFLPIGFFAILSLFFWRGLSLNPHELPSVRLNQKLPAFKIPVLGDKLRQFSPESMHGHPAILHVFASWCDACAEEQVFLLKLADAGLPIYGLNYKDAPLDATHWLQTWGNPYQLIGIDREGHVGIDLGVYGTPETFLIDSNGLIRYRHVGALNARVWAQELLPHWKVLS